MGFGGTGKGIRVYSGVLTATAGTGQSSAPGNGATVTLFDSTAQNPIPGVVLRPPATFKRLHVTIISSHDSGANGFVVEGSEDGTQWDSISSFYPQTYTTAGGRNFWDITRTTPHIRVRYTNSANALTKWQASVELFVDHAASS